jgi:hypothetical protein
MTRPNKNSTAYHDTTFVDGQTRYVADLDKYIDHLEAAIKDWRLYSSTLEVEVKELSEILEN